MKEKIPPKEEDYRVRFIKYPDTLPWYYQIPESGLPIVRENTHKGHNRPDAGIPNTVVHLAHRIIV